ncbi:MAG: hypothetical protein QOG85_594 [Gaiellaceae bacterium]|jgi:hypothetical protein|nr:hypothetical protein [Gaiellaceae bacterium]
MIEYGKLARRLLPLAVVAAAAVGASAAKAPVAQAALGCTYPSMAPVFLRWLDPSSYFLAPGANFENGLGGWTASGGAGVVSGNETYNVGGPGSQSLALPTTSAVATTPTFCVSVDAPTLRLLVKNNGMSDGQLAVYMNFQDANGKLQQVKVAALKPGNTSWNLTAPIVFAQYLSLPILKSGYANVSFTFKPNDTHGNWQIDDMYVDPCISR